MFKRTKWRVEDYLRKLPERMLMFVVWRLPRVVVKWAYIRVGAHATTGKYEKTVVPELSMMEALQRWES